MRVLRLGEGGPRGGEKLIVWRGRQVHRAVEGCASAHQLHTHHEVAESTALDKVVVHARDRQIEQQMHATNGKSCRDVSRPAERVEVDAAIQQRPRQLDADAAVGKRLRHQLLRGQLQEEAADIELLAERMNPENWTVAESKYMYQRSWDSSRAMRKKTEHIKRTKRPKPEEPNR